MKILVIYYSQTGKTERVAKELTATPVSGYLATCSGLNGKESACFATCSGGSARSTRGKLRTKLKEKEAEVIGSLGVNSTRPFSDKIKDSISSDYTLD